MLLFISLPIIGDPLNVCHQNHPTPRPSYLYSSRSKKVPTYTLPARFGCGSHRPQIPDSIPSMPLACWTVDRKVPRFVSLNWHNRSASLILLGPDRDLNFKHQHVLFLLLSWSLWMATSNSKGSLPRSTLDGFDEANQMP